MMVGAQPQQNYAQHGASNVQLMSLLREGGQWDEDDDLRAGMARTRTESKAFEDVEWGKEAIPEEQPGLPAVSSAEREPPSRTDVISWRISRRHLVSARRVRR